MPAHPPDGITEGLKLQNLGRSCSTIPLVSASASPLASASKTSTRFSPPMPSPIFQAISACKNACLPLTLSGCTPSRKYFATAAERSSQNIPAKSLPSPYLLFSSFWPQPFHRLCSPPRMPFPQIFLGLALPPTSSKRPPSSQYPVSLPVPAENLLISQFSFYLLLLDSGHELQPRVGLGT